MSNISRVWHTHGVVAEKLGKERDFFCLLWQSVVVEHIDVELLEGCSSSTLESWFTIVIDLVVLLVSVFHHKFEFRLVVFNVELRVIVGQQALVGCIHFAG